MALHAMHVITANESPIVASHAASTCSIGVLLLLMMIIIILISRRHGTKTGFAKAGLAVQGSGTHLDVLLTFKGSI